MPTVVTAGGGGGGSRSIIVAMFPLGSAMVPIQPFEPSPPTNSSEKVSFWKVLLEGQNWRQALVGTILNRVEGDRPGVLPIGERERPVVLVGGIDEVSTVSRRAKGAEFQNMVRGPSV